MPSKQRAGGAPRRGDIDTSEADKRQMGTSGVPLHATRGDDKTEILAKIEYRAVSFSATLNLMQLRISMR